MIGRILIVAGSDSGGGAGIQADVKTVTALNGYAATAITALTAQNTRGVFGVVAVEPAFIAQQMRLVLEDIGADCVKTGMLHSSRVIDAVADVLAGLAPETPLVADPVMYAKGGESLLDPEARETLINRILPRAAVLTPNRFEAEALSGMTIRDVNAMSVAAERLLAMGPAAVLLKGGRMEGETVVDLLASREGVERFVRPRLVTRHTHGAGCTLAAAIATGLAQGMPVTAAVSRALAYVHKAIRTAPGLGSGRGPLNHSHTVQSFST